MTTTNDLYQAATKNDGTSRHELPNGDVLICAVDRVAGRSITRRHYRTTWHLKLVTEQYSKQVSRKRAQEILS